MTAAMATPAAQTVPAADSATSNPRCQPNNTGSDLARIIGLLFFIILAVTSAGCLGETTCRELGCPADNERCNLETGECEPINQACEPGDCPDGEVCDRASGQCQPELPACGDGQSCPEGLQCNVDSQTCEVNPGCTPGSCTSPAETCNAATDRCEPQACDADAACPTGYICTESQCRAGCRGDSARCPPDRFCSSDSPGDLGQCLPECRSNQSCPHGQICVNQDGLRTCRPEGPCDNDSACRDDEVCINQRCVAPPCTEDDDCDGNQACHRATGSCVGGDCEDDALSPNHRPQSAAGLQLNTYTGLKLCPGRDDWYTYRASSSQALIFELQYDGQTDLDLFVYDESGRLIGQNRRPAPGAIETSDRIRLMSTRQQTLRVRVSGHQHEPEPSQVSYALGIQTDDARFCRDDAEEENDTLATATQLSAAVGVPTDVSFQVCGSDQDIFALDDFTADQGLSVSLDDAAPHLRLDTLPPSRPTSVLAPGDSQRWYRIGDAETWYFRVGSLLDQSGGYSYRFEILPPWDCPDAQAHSSPSTALPVDMTAPTSATFCPVDGGWEVDWISLQSPPQANSLLRTIVAPNDAMPPINVTLFKRGVGGTPVIVRPATQTDSGIEVAAPFGPTDTPLLRISSSATPDTLAERPRYQISYDYQTP
jgi:hypothetical protein